MITTEQEHRYLSTACHHRLHTNCRLTCKWCPAACRCWCHAAARAALLPPRWPNIEGAAEGPSWEAPTASGVA